MLSNYNKILIKAYRKGYRVIDGKVYNPFGYQLKLRNINGYYHFNFGSGSGRTQKRIKVHRLVAYQKYGDKLFESGIEVRHKNNDSKNNLDDNILIGTSSQNKMDINPEDRLEHAKKASSHIRKFSNAEVEEIRRTYAGIRSYKQVMEMFDISSKGTLHHILNNDYQTEKMPP